MYTVQSLSVVIKAIALVHEGLQQWAMQTYRTPENKPHFNPFTVDPALLHDSTSVDDAQALSLYYLLHDQCTSRIDEDSQDARTFK